MYYNMYEKIQSDDIMYVIECILTVSINQEYTDISSFFDTQDPNS